MQDISVGVDMIEIDRIALDFGAFRDTGSWSASYTESEIAYCRGRAPQLAARFAAKEAAMKALGTGTRGVGWREVEVTRKRSGEPEIALHGRAGRSGPEARDRPPGGEPVAFARLRGGVGRGASSLEGRHVGGDAAAGVACGGGGGSGGVTDGECGTRGCAQHRTPSGRRAEQAYRRVGGAGGTTAAMEWSRRVTWRTGERW